MAQREFEGLPPQVRRLLHNVEIGVKALPGAEAGRWKGSRRLLGLYSGLTREQMLSPMTGTHLPSRIVLYQRNLEDGCGSPDELSRRVATTLRHEIAHHFGFSEEELRRAWPEGA